MIHVTFSARSKSAPSPWGEGWGEGTDAPECQKSHSDSMVTAKLCRKLLK